jgi:hypothetical protein
MGIRFKLSDTYRTEVNFAVFNEKGKRENLSFTAQFKRKNKEEVKELVESSQKPGRDDSDLLREVMTGWVMVDLDSGERCPSRRRPSRSSARFPARPGSRCSASSRPSARHAKKTDGGRPLPRGRH